MVLNRAIRHILFIGLFSIACIGRSQSNNVKVANEYFNKRDYEKAYDYYKKLISDERDRRYVYNNYVGSVRKLGLYEKGLDQIEKLLKKEPQNYAYIVDKILLLTENNKENKAAAAYEKLKRQTVASKIESKKAYNFLALRQMNDKAIELLLESRIALKQKYVYAEELSLLYKNKGDKNKMFNELVNIIEDNPREAEAVQNALVVSLQTKAEYNTVIDNIYKRLGEDPRIEHNELLVWLYMQQKDFYNAFLQQKTIDKQQTVQRGRELIELGDIAYLNNDYKTAIKVYTYVTEEYPTEYHYIPTKRKLIQTKEVLAKDEYPVNAERIREIIADYDLLLTKSRRIDENARIMINKAELYAVYLREEKNAISLLNEVTANARLNKSIKSRAKIMLGDIYTLLDDTGESMLMYMQVEREMPDDELGNLAKLKTAKVSYYEGEFELAQAHLDILKRATQRKIANDAQDLSLLIKGNLALDTTPVPMQLYADTELLIFQKKYNEALEQLNKIMRLYPNHSLSDEIHYQKAKIYENLTNHSKSAEELQQVVLDAESVYQDDALILLAELYDRRLGDKQKAKEYYKRLLIDCAGSIHVEAARKRYYELEGE